jgi:hypothetical protein
MGTFQTLVIAKMKTVKNGRILTWTYHLILGEQEKNTLILDVIFVHAIIEIKLVASCLGNTLLLIMM